jgi:hypothetical protein
MHHCATLAVQDLCQFFYVNNCATLIGQNRNFQKIIYKK